MYRRIRAFYQSWYPFSAEQTRQKAAMLFCGILAVSFPLMLCYLRAGSSYLNVLLAMLIPFFLQREALQVAKMRETEKAKKALEMMLAGIRHQYYRSPVIAEAVHLASENQRGEALLHLDHLFEILDSRERGELAAEYRRKVVHPFYRMLLTQTVLIEEHGDEEQAGESVYLWSLGHLRRELELDYRNKRRLRHLFSGLGMVVLLPVFFLPWIHRWAVGSLPELSAFYQGAAGRGMELLLLMVTFFFYQLLDELKGEKRNERMPNPLREHKLWRIFAKAAAAHYLSRPSEREKRKTQLKRIGDGRTPEEFFCGQIFWMFVSVPGAVFLSALFWRYGRDFELLFLGVCLLAPVLGYWYPVLRLYLANRFLEDRMQEEVLNFQFSICLLMRMPGISTLELLETMEENAVIFRSSLQQCIRDCSSQEKEALLWLWQSEPYPAFRRLADMFLMIEDSGITEAFRELETDMEDYQENRKLEMEILQERRAEAAMLLACVPGLFVLFGYLIIPFMMECFRMLSQYNNSLALG